MSRSRQRYWEFPKGLVFNSLQTRLKWQIHEQLKTFRDYALVIQAFNRMGAGPKSQEIIVTTMEDGKHRKRKT